MTTTRLPVGSFDGLSRTERRPPTLPMADRSGDRTVASLGELIALENRLSRGYGDGQHTKVDTTMNVYTQVLDGAARLAADRVGSELFRVVQIPDGTTTPTH